MSTTVLEHEVGSGTEKQIVAFSIGPETYGVDIGSIREIIPSQRIVPVPRAPEYVEGIINLRGRIIPVLDLRKHFGLSEAEKGSDQRIILVESGSESIGVVVDAVSSVLHVPESSIEVPVEVIVGPDIEYIQGIAKMEEGLVVLVDLTRLISDAERKTLKETTKAILN